MRASAFLFGAAAAFAFAPAVAAQDAPFEVARVVSDATLAEARGGFELPNGMNIRLGIAMDTLVNGRLVLSTVLTLDETSHLAIYAGGAIHPQTSATEFLVSGPDGASLVRITQDASFSRGDDGRQPVAVLANGDPVLTQWGAVRLEQSDTQSTVFLAGNGLDLRHMIGAATGALVANTASDRVIDTMITIDVDLRGAAIPTGTMILRLDNLLAGAATRGGY